MQKRWSIKTDWAQLDSGSPEERAGFAALNITVYGSCLTAGHDRLLQSVREAPFLSAYHLAEWLAWNWWRLRWEPRKTSTEWQLSHAMASIGQGYIWPNISILSDGKNITFIAQPTPERERTPWRYISDAVSVISGTDFENEVDLFIETVVRRLADCQIIDSNLAAVWQAVLDERQDATLSQLRKLEALLGEDPGEMDEALLHRLLHHAARTGHSALEEIAANRTAGQQVPDIGALIELACSKGIPTQPTHRVKPPSQIFANMQEAPAWKVGADAARTLRKQLNMATDTHVSNHLLAELYGVPVSAVDTQPVIPALDLSLSWAVPNQAGRMLLRSKWETGRRFELARLLGDHWVYATDDPMRPATRSGTYRQKVQRAFAAEFLSPFQTVDAMLGGDYSMESQQDVAHHFGVSALTVSTQLANHDRINRSEIDEVC